ncbi:pirin [Saccharospirillum sp. MSK14-1]|uniref:pirin family protein n=1 Tax=Saccharospirillum sp. MSK14-1 TaxID=1897632 RepID=UPI000D35493A|nr:pirin family protein [Saccharospirillum sp. MSK14-1]PTY36175.1 pirin [Saccharospirillum sp. MSK14-1]
MIRVRLANQRGHAQHGWLDSHHSFSFANYYDPNYMGFSDLRVINDDWVAPGSGFDTHGHRDMEIITYVLEGTIAHRDTMNNVSQLKAGEVQVMSAGSGVMHSEYNASQSERLNFLQIWVLPNVAGVEPSYAQQDFSALSGINRIVSPDGSEGSLAIRQDASLYQVRLEQEAQSFTTAKDRLYYLQVAHGELSVNGVTMSAGDGAYIAEEDRLSFETATSVDALLFELRGH